MMVNMCVQHVPAAHAGHTYSPIKLDHIQRHGKILCYALYRRTVHTLREYEQQTLVRHL